MKTSHEPVLTKKTTLTDGHPIFAASLSALILAHRDHETWMRSQQRKEQA